MFDRLFVRIYDWSTRHQRAILLGLLCIAILSVFGLLRMEFDDEIERLIPAQPDVVRSLRFLREAQFSDKVVLSVTARKPEMSRDDLIEAVDAFALSLQGELVSEVVSTVVNADVMNDVGQSTAYVPQLLGPEELRKLDGELNEASVTARVASIYTRILSPGGEFMLPVFRRDPLGLAGDMLSSLRDLSSSLPYRADIVRGHVVSEDGRGVLLILHTPVRSTDGSGSRRLLEHIASCVERSGPDINVAVIAAHRHVVSNEDVVRTDLQRTCTVAALAFVLLFIPFSRDGRAGLILLIPVFSVLVAINLAGLFLGRLSFFMAGLAAVMTGIAVDYGIHAYVAKMIGGAAAVKIVSRPLLIGATTTMSVFAALFFSSLPVYSELACFAILSILLSVFLSLFVLPQLVAERRVAGWLGLGGRSISRPRRRLVLGIWIGVVLVSALFVPGVAIENDLRHFDGSEQAVFDDEERFHRMWGGREHPAILVTEGPTFDDALRASGEIAARVRAEMDGGAYGTLASVWRPQDVRERNLTAWNDFWRGGGEERVRTYLAAAGEKYGFTEDMFEPFLDGLYASRVTPGLPSAGVFEHLRNRFVVSLPEEEMVLSYFEDTESNVATVAAIVANRAGAYVVSRRAIARSISKAAREEVVKLAFFAGTLVLALVLLILRTVGLAALSLIPVGTSLLCIFGLFGFLELPLTAPVVMGALIVIGLSIDYGVFMVYDTENRVERGLPTALALSAATSIAGAGSLLFARHPVMFSIGVTLTTGVLAGYLSAVLVIPALHSRSGRTS